MKSNSNKSKEMAICFTPDENVRNSIPSIVIVVSGPTPNKALFKELVAPPGDFSLIVPVCSQVI